MNKILVSNIIDLFNETSILEFQEDSCIVNISGEVNLYILNENLKKMIINLKDNSKLNMYKYDNMLKNNIEIDIYQNNNSEVLFNKTFINEDNVSIKINSFINGNYNKANILVRNICNKNDSYITVNLDILKNTTDNIVTEDIRGINNGGNITVLPNILCSSSEVVANHLTTIGILDKDSINYLMSKGINCENSKNILLEGFIKSNMDENLKKILGGEINA